MIKYFCDLCGKEVKEWELIKYKSHLAEKLDLCVDCHKSYLEKLAEIEKIVMDGKKGTYEGIRKIMGISKNKNYND